MNQLYQTVPGVVEARVNHMISVAPLIDADGDIALEVASVLGSSTVTEPGKIKLADLIESLISDYDDEQGTDAVARIAAKLGELKLKADDASKKSPNTREYPGADGQLELPFDNVD